MVLYASQRHEGAKHCDSCCCMRWRQQVAARRLHRLGPGHALSKVVGDLVLSLSCRTESECTAASCSCHGRHVLRDCQLLTTHSAAVQGHTSSHALQHNMLSSDVIPCLTCPKLPVVMLDRFL